ncbi:MAG: hypothetical protein C7B46_19265 [Sulfobacillus benefaciens]|uniref:Tyr recombinase domain-containing protein n=1 Tax=Sulfobacillus benefaciens TaxID=453960 RepID=A0A2T2WZZ4_9FIRM|nr:MAG: hypothetical protein C7B46_19265 [Sulfobacillus benefaciens]
MTSLHYTSSLASLIEGLIQQKQAMGYSYHGEARILHHFDQFVGDQGWTAATLEKPVVVAWTQRRSHEAHATWRHRCTPVRQLALYMADLGIPAYVPPAGQGAKRPTYIPYIYSDAELVAFFRQVDACRYQAEVPYRHWTLPLLFRVLYGTGMRLSEALHLRLEDVDHHAGIVTVRDGKFHKDRLLPVVESLRQQLVHYHQQVHPLSRPNTVYFLAGPDRPLTGGNVYKNFRRFLWRAGISHGGWSKGPRVHDFRHTYSVHCLRRWVREGRDLTAALPLLKTYLGHYSFQDTAHYLRLTADLFPDIVLRMEETLGHVVPSVGGDGH